MTNRSLRLEQVLRKKKCSKCGKKRLIQKEPNEYKKVRCLQCGSLFRLRHT